MKHNKFKAYLVENNIKQIEVANVLGVSRTALVNKLSNKTKFSVEDINKIQKTFGLTDRQVKAFFLNV